MAKSKFIFKENCIIPVSDSLRFYVPAGSSLFYTSNGEYQIYPKEYSEFQIHPIIIITKDQFDGATARGDIASV